MTAATAQQLQKKHCKPCEGSVKACSLDEARQQLRQLDGWSLDGGDRIQKKWQLKDFMAGMKFLNDVAKIAQDEDHHPDVHLEDYKNVRIELTTHAIGGLSENDFILAAKIDALSSGRK